MLLSSYRLDSNWLTSSIWYRSSEIAKRRAAPITNSECHPCSMNQTHWPQNIGQLVINIYMPGSMPWIIESTRAIWNEQQKFKLTLQLSQQRLREVYAYWWNSEISATPTAITASWNLHTCSKKYYLMHIWDVVKRILESKFTLQVLNEHQRHPYYTFPMHSAVPRKL